MLAVVALVIGVSSGAVAAKLITGADVKNGSLTTKDIKNGTLTTKDIKKAGVAGDRLKKSAIGTDRLKDGAVGPAKIKDGAVNSAKIKDGSVQAKDLNSELNTLLPAQVKNLTGSFTNSDTTVTLTPDGVSFGPYVNGGASGGSLIYSGLNGKALNSVKNLVYYARYMATNDTGGVGVPYLRIFLEDGHDAIFSPNTQQPNPDTAQGPFHEWVTTSGSWRYDDDSGTGSDEPYAQLLADHGTEAITSVRVSVGNSSGTDLQALLRWMQINGKTFNFGS